MHIKIPYIVKLYIQEKNLCDNFTRGNCNMVSAIHEKDFKLFMGYTYFPIQA